MDLPALAIQHYYNKQGNNKNMYHVITVNTKQRKSRNIVVKREFFKYDC